MLDYKEFFAEMSVTYLCNSYHEYCCGLDNSSNKGSSDNDYILSTTANNNPGRDDTTLLNMETYCPPIIEPNTTARVIEKYNHIYRDRNRFTSNDEQSDDEDFGEGGATYHGSMMMMKDKNTMRVIPRVLVAVGGYGSSNHYLDTVIIIINYHQHCHHRHQEEERGV